MATKEKSAPKTNYRYYTTTGSNGETLYTFPVEIKTQADRRNFNITDADCVTIRFGKSEKATVYLFMTPNKELSDYQWQYLNTQHSRSFAETRCMVPGKRKTWIKCQDIHSCAKCPHNGKKMLPIISFDELLMTGYEPEAATSADERAVAVLELEELRILMDLEDSRIFAAWEMQVCGYTLKEIASHFRIACSTAHYLIKRAKEIAKAYDEMNQ